MMEMVPREDGGVERFLRRLKAGDVDVVVLTSQNGLRFILDGVADKSAFVERMNEIQVLAIGPKTKKALEESGIHAKYMPTVFSSDGIVGEFAFPHKNVDVLRSDHGNPILVKGLEEGGAHVIETIVYDIVPLRGEAQEAFVKEALSGRIDAYTFTSIMTAKSLLMMAESMGKLKELKDAVNAKKVAVIGHPTASFLRESGIRVDVVPERFTFEDMVDALAKVL